MGKGAKTTRLRLGHDCEAVRTGSNSIRVRASDGYPPFNSSDGRCAPEECGVLIFSAP